MIKIFIWIKGKRGRKQAQNMFQVREHILVKKTF